MEDLILEPFRIGEKIEGNYSLSGFSRGTKKVSFHLTIRLFILMGFQFQLADRPRDTKDMADPWVWVIARGKRSMWVKPGLVIECNFNFEVLAIPWQITWATRQTRHERSKFLLSW